MSTMPNPDGVQIKSEKQKDGTWRILDNTGWSTTATSEVFAKAIVERRKIVVGQTDLL